MRSHTIAKISAPSLGWEHATPAPPGQSTVLQVVSFLRQTLEAYQESAFIRYLIAPSPCALTRVFRCGEDAIAEALQELQRQGYEYETSGRSGPIVLWDPLVRPGSVQP